MLRFPGSVPIAIPSCAASEHARCALVVCLLLMAGPVPTDRPILLDRQPSRFRLNSNSMNQASREPRWALSAVMSEDPSFVFPAMQYAFRALERANFILANASVRVKHQTAPAHSVSGDAEPISKWHWRVGGSFNKHTISTSCGIFKPWHDPFRDQAQR